MPPGGLELGLGMFRWWSKHLYNSTFRDNIDSFVMLNMCLMCCLPITFLGTGGVSGSGFRIMDV